MSRTVTMALTVSMLCFVGCTGQRLQMPSEDRVRADFSDGPGDVVDPGQLAEKPSIDLYIDGSGSMRGFVTPENSRFRRTLTGILQHCASTGFPVRAHTFFKDSGKPLSKAPIPEPVSRSVLDAGLYVHEETPLASLLEEIAKQPPNRISIIVSDMVQSELKSADQVQLVNAMSTLGSRQVAVSLLAFRSSFQGQVWSEIRKQDPGREAALSESRPGGGRPFYLLIVAPSTQHVASLEKAVLVGLEEHESFLPGGAAIRVEAVGPALARIPDREGAWVTHTRCQNETPGTAPMFAFQFWKEGRSRQQYPVLRLAGRVTESATVHDWSRLEARVEKRGYGPLGDPIESPPDIRVRVRHGDGDSLLVELQPKALPVGSWAAYRIRLSPGLANLSVPVWVKDWSTEDDTSPTQDTRTLYFSLLVEALTRSITEKLDFYDTIVLVTEGS